MCSDDLEVGDVIILEAHNNHVHGHIEVYTGRSGRGKYSSDFKQYNANIWSDGHGRIKVYRYNN